MNNPTRLPYAIKRMLDLDNWCDQILQHLIEILVHNHVVVMSERQSLAQVLSRRRSLIVLQRAGPEMRLNQQSTRILWIDRRRNNDVEETASSYLWHNAESTHTRTHATYAHVQPRKWTATRACVSEDRVKRSAHVCVADALSLSMFRIWLRESTEPKSKHQEDNRSAISELREEEEEKDCVHHFNEPRRSATTHLFSLVPLQFSPYNIIISLKRVKIRTAISSWRLARW